MSLRNLLIRSGAVKPRSGITSWAGWPEDVVETLRRWNGNGRLSFRYTRSGSLFDSSIGRFPRCEFCGEHFEREATVAVLYQKRDANQHRAQRGRITCDDCLIARARSAND